MQSIDQLQKLVNKAIADKKYPDVPAELYDPINYLMSLGGKRMRPVMLLMACDLFNGSILKGLDPAIGIELFHNFTLIHDDIMDKAPLRRGMQTVHQKYGESTALLAGDVMLVAAYDYLNKIKTDFLHRIIHLFNKTAREVCEGQQLDMDFEKRDEVKLFDYIKMIELKTSVLLAASLQLGAILGGAGKGNQEHLYEFGRNLGIAFQVQDDYLDAFGDPGKFGKQVGGDIIANKKTFLLIKAMELANPSQEKELKTLIASSSADKVSKVLQIFHDCGVDEWAKTYKDE